MNNNAYCSLAYDYTRIKIHLSSFCFHVMPDEIAPSVSKASRDLRTLSPRDFSPKFFSFRRRGTALDQWNTDIKAPDKDIW